jgi:hypothetical protein
MRFVDLIGWTATAVFVGSYAFRHPDRLRQAQMVGAAIWVGYGVLMQAPPIIVANLLVLGAAGWASWRNHRIAPGRTQSHLVAPGRTRNPARMVD